MSPVGEAIESSAPPLHALSVLVALYPGNTFRVCIHPTQISDFPGGGALQGDVKRQKLRLRKDSQGMLQAEKKGLQFVFDPPTGSFRFSHPGRSGLTGSLQTGKFSAAHLFIRHNAEDRVYGFGSPLGGTDASQANFRLTPGRSLPFFMIRKVGGEYAGIFLNTRAAADVAVLGSDNLEWGPGTYFEFDEEAAVGLDLFVLSGSPAEILDRYSELTGRPRLPPLWSLGCQHARQHIKSADQLLKLADRFRMEDIPCDALSTGQQALRLKPEPGWDPARFADPAATVRRLEAGGLQLVAELPRRLSESEPDGTGLTLAALGAGTHGLFLPEQEAPAAEPVLDTRQTVEAFETHAPGRRAFVLSRNAACGVQSHAAVYARESTSSWAGLRTHLGDVLNLGLSGVPLSAADVGGLKSPRSFLSGLKLRPDAELFARWVALGSLMPLFRNSTCRFSPGQEPWSYTQDTLAIARKFMRRRYRLLPYLYRLSYDSSRTGAPIVRPMFYEFPDLSPDIAPDQFMFGESMLVAPVLTPGARRRSVYLPEGQWYEFESGESFVGNSAYTIEAGLDYLPLFVRAGSVLPVCRGGHNAATSIQQGLVLEVYPAARMQGSLYLDDGQTRAHEKRGHFQHTKISGRRDRTGQIALTLSNVHKRFGGSPAEVEVRLPAEFKTLRPKGRGEIVGQPEDLAAEDRRYRVTVFQTAFNPGRWDFNI